MTTSRQTLADGQTLADAYNSRKGMVRRRATRQCWGACLARGVASSSRRRLLRKLAEDRRARGEVGPASSPRDRVPRRSTPRNLRLMALAALCVLPFVTAAPHPRQVMGIGKGSTSLDMNEPTESTVDDARDRLKDNRPDGARWVTSFWYQLRVLLQRQSKQSRGEVRRARPGLPPCGHSAGTVAVRALALSRASPVETSAVIA